MVAAGLISGRFIHAISTHRRSSTCQRQAIFEGVGSFECRGLRNAPIFPDGSASIDFIWSDYYAGPNTIVSESWYFVPAGGLLNFDNVTATPFPMDALPGALTVEVTMADVALALAQTTMPAKLPVIFRVTNSSSGSAHSAVIVTSPEGTTAEEIIAADAVRESTGIVDVGYLEPGQAADLGITGPDPGS